MFSWAALRRQGRQAEDYGVDQPRGGHPGARPSTNARGHGTTKRVVERAYITRLGERMRSARKHAAHRIQPAKQDPSHITKKVCICFDCQAYRTTYHIGTAANRERPE